MTATSTKEGNIGIALIANIVSIAVTAIISFFLTKYLIEEIGKIAYSYYPIANNIVNYFSLIFLALNGMSARFVSVAMHTKGEREAQSYFSSIFFADSIISLGISLFAILYIFNLNSFLAVPDNLVSNVKILFVFTFAGAVIDGLRNAYTVGPYVKKRMDVSAIIEIIANVFKCLCLLFFAAFGKLDLITFGLSLFLTSVLRFIVYLLANKSLLPDFKFILKLIDRRKIIMLTKAGVWCILDGLGLMLITNSQIIVANNFVSFDVSSDIALAQNLYSLAIVLCDNINSMFVPYILDAVISKRKDMDMYLNNIKTVSLIVMLLPCAVLIALGRQFFALWLPNENSYVLALYSGLMLMQLIFRYISNVSRAIQTTYNEIKTPAFAQLLIGCIFVLSIFIGAKYFDLNGTFILAMAILAFFAYSLLFSPWFSNHILKNNGVTYRLNYLPELFIILLIVVVNTLIGINIPSLSWLGLFACGALMVLVDILLVLVIKKENLFNIIKFVFNKR